MENEIAYTWLPGPLLTEIPNNSTKYIRHAAGDIVVIHWDGAFTAYRN